MSKKVSILTLFLFLMALSAVPCYAAETSSAGNSPVFHWEALAMAIAAAGCGIAQSKTLTAGCEGVARNPGSTDTIRFFIILGLAFIEFLALLTFVVVLFMIGVAPGASFLG